MLTKPAWSNGSLDAATTKGVIARLIERGLVHVEDDPVDLRRLKISLTKVGLDLTIYSIEKAKKITADTVQNLSPRDVKSLLALLDKIEISK